MAYGPQGWWPVVCERRRFRNPEGEREIEGYHPGEFDFPRTRRGRFEIACGAILTQNTAWSNVQKALLQLRTARVTSPERLLEATPADLGELIRPAGYFNQKTRYLRAMSEWFVAQDPTILRHPATRTTLEAVRPELLAVRGVGPETADSILLYAYGLPTFVVDAYTRRVMSHLGLIEPTWTYEQIRAFCERAVSKKDDASTVRAYQEAHALIVEHAKRHHRGKMSTK